MDKQEIQVAIVAALTAELESYLRSARAARAEAADEESKAENKYDTRGLEASYLAQGQSQQAVELRNALQEFQAIPTRTFTPADPIDLGAVVQLENDSERSFYYIGPRAGGTEVECDGVAILVITPQSPLGSQLVGKTEGSEVDLTIGWRKFNYTIAKVW